MFILRAAVTFSLATATLAGLETASLAHHSIASEYGGGAGPTKTLEGTITKVRWSNPHIEVYVDVTGGDVPKGEWIVNSHAPGLLARTYGIRSSEVSVGDKVKIVGWESRQGVERFHMRAIAVKDGPLRSTHRSSDIKDMAAGTLGAIVPAPGITADSKDEYGANIGGSAKGDAQPAATAKADAPAPTAEAGGLSWLWLAVVASAAALAALLFKRKAAAK
jgi:hypothetical protein